MGFRALVESEVREATQDLSRMRSFHKEDKGEIGSMYYCKKCRHETKRSDTIMGYKVAGQVAYFSREELEEKNPKHVQILGPTDMQIEPRLVKDTYALLPNSKASTAEKVNYGITLDALKSNIMLGAIVKLHSGYRQGERRAVIRYNPETQTPEIVELHYPEELIKIEPAELGITLNAEKVRAAREKVYGNNKINMDDYKEQRVAEIMEHVKSRLGGKEEMQEDKKVITADSTDGILDAIIGVEK